MIEMTEQQRADWLRKEAWTFEELSRLCCGLVTNSRPEERQAQLRTAERAIEDAEFVGSLTSIPKTNPTHGDVLYGSHKRYRPAEAIAWAARRFPDDFPFEPTAIVAASVPSAGTGNDVTLRERKTLLLLLAALCKHASIDWRERGAAARIATLTQEAGWTIHEDTIRKYLGQLQEAVDARMR